MSSLRKNAGEIAAALIQGMEPLGALLDDAEVNDILINGPDAVFVERMGRLEKTDLRFAGEAALRELGEAIAKAVGRELNPVKPMVDARLADGSRVNVIAPPLAVDGTTISIRKFARTSLTLAQMARQGNISGQLAEFLEICGASRTNMIISGGTGSGKTTLLGAISQHIGENERVVTIEDAAELRLLKPHVVRLETRPAMDGGEEVTTRELVRNALRMRPDRILIGEVRGEEAFDLMQAMNTGHEGSLTTLHANHPRDALTRLENMVGLAGVHMPLRNVRGQIASALHLIVQTSRMRDGLRRVTYVSEIVGMEGEVITLQELMRFTVAGEDKNGFIQGEWHWTGIVPRFIRRIAYWGQQERFCKLFNLRLPGV